MMKTFNPVRLSNAENQFLLKWLGQPSVVALKDIKGQLNPKAHPRDKNPIIYPDGVIPASVKPILDGVYELQELATHEGLQWVGVDAMKQAIEVWLAQNQKWSSDHQKRRNAPRWPSLYSYDAKGVGHLSGTGSDSGEVKTYFGPAGERIPFEIELMSDVQAPWIAPTVGSEDLSASGGVLFVDPVAHRIECRVPQSDGTICGHTESYKDSSRASYNAARARMSKHLRKATNEPEAHRELHTLEFNS
jgi:hypothetical protein